MRVGAAAEESKSVNKDARATLKVPHCGKGRSHNENENNNNNGVNNEKGTTFTQSVLRHVIIRPLVMS